MGFASDGVSPIGGAAEIGQGRPSVIAGAIEGTDREPVRNPLALFGFTTYANFRPLLQSKNRPSPDQRSKEHAPGGSNVFGNAWLRLMDFLSTPQPTRGDNKKTEEERVKFLSGQPKVGGFIDGGPPDPEGRGLMFEPVDTHGVNFHEPGNTDIMSADNNDPAPIINTDPKDGLTPHSNLSRDIQGYPTNEHDQLAPWRQSFPSAPVLQAPIGRSLTLAQIAGAGDFVGEMSIPDGTVAVRLTWTQKATNDLWVSFNGAATSTPAGTVTGGIQAPVQASPVSDGPILNPDDTKYYLVKGKRAIGLACKTVCTVNIQFYQQA